MITSLLKKDHSILITGGAGFLGSAREFEFKAKIPLEDGLRKTVEWYQQTHCASHSSSQGDQPS